MASPSKDLGNCRGNKSGRARQENKKHCYGYKWQNQDIRENTNDGKLAHHVENVRRNENLRGERRSNNAAQAKFFGNNR